MESNLVSSQNLDTPASEPCLGDPQNSTPQENFVLMLHDRIVQLEAENAQIRKQHEHDIDRLRRDMGTEMVRRWLFQAKTQRLSTGCRFVACNNTLADIEIWKEVVSTTSYGLLYDPVVKWKILTLDREISAGNSDDKQSFLKEMSEVYFNVSPRDWKLIL